MTTPVLTVIVVTKGRKEYLSALLDSLEGQLDEHTSAFVVDNGSTDGSAELIRHWCARNASCTDFIRLEQNTHDFRTWIDLAKDRFMSDWVTFPGDDDILLAGHLADIRQEILQSPQVTVVAAGCQDMHADGTMLSSSQIPESAELGSRAEVIGRLLARPQFLWPSVAFRASALQGPLPNYRFTFDWWVQLRCLLAGEYATTGRASVAYRRHPEQEGHMWSTRRKYAEASWMLHGVLLSEQFKNFASGLSQSETDLVLDSVLATGGCVYGDPIFGLPVTMAAVQVLSQHRSATTSALALASLASSSLEISPSQATLMTWLGTNSEVIQELPSAAPRPLEATAAAGLCPRATHAMTAANIQQVAGTSIKVMCAHHHGSKSTATSSVALIACQSGGDDSALAQSLRERVEAVMEDNASLTSGLQPMERRLLTTYRAAVSLLPRRIKAMMRSGVRR